MDWFWKWLLLHQRLCPHQGWKTYGLDPDGRRDLAVWLPWQRVFAARRISLELATLASERLQRHHPGWPEHHLEAVLDEVDAIRREIAAEGQREAMERARAEARRLNRRRELARTRWEAMSEADRARVRDAVQAECPALRAWARLLELMCLDAISQGDVDETADQEPVDSAGPLRM